MSQRRPNSVQGAQRLQLDGPTYVNDCVEQMNASEMAMAEATTRRFVKVAPPTIHAGIGNALRHAYSMDGELRSLKKFEELLARLD
jgi:hypothetical protein